MHLSNDGRLVAEGDIVSAGDPIAISGNTGWSRGPHLHFHVIENVTAQRIPVLFATQYRNRDTLEYGRTYRHPIRETKFTPKVRRTKRWTEDQVERARKWFVWLAGRTPVGSA